MSPEPPTGSDAPPGPGPGARTSPLEAVVAVLGAVAVAALVAYMTAVALLAPDGPPRFAFTTDAVSPAAEGHLVQFTVRNEGGSTAASVRVVLSLLSGGRVVERRVATFDTVPEGASSSGGIFLARDPDAHTLEFRAESYAQP